MNWKAFFNDYAFYAVKVLIGAVILVIVAIGSTPDVFRERLKSAASADDAN